MSHRVLSPKPAERRPSRHLPRRSLLVVWALSAAAGCGPKPNQVFIETFANPLAPKKYATTFTEAYFSKTAGGGLDILLRWQQPTERDPTQEMEQIVHVHTFWRPVYGTTRAEASMINATLRFIILTPPTGVCYEGAGFVTFKINRNGTTLDGMIEAGELAPTRTLGGAQEPFGPARISGSIHAIEDRRELVRLLHRAERTFEPASPP